MTRSRFLPHRAQQSRPGQITRDSRESTRGQSIVEFALIVPLMLALVGMTLDVARVYQAWITLQGATRDAAEFVATRSQSASMAAADAKDVVCSQTTELPGFQGNASNCVQPDVSIVSFSRSTTAPGATASNPIGNVTVRSTLPFETLFDYPILTEGGVWTITVTESYSVVQNR